MHTLIKLLFGSSLLRKLGIPIHGTSRCWEYLYGVLWTQLGRTRIKITFTTDDNRRNSSLAKPLLNFFHIQNPPEKSRGEVTLGGR